MVALFLPYQGLEASFIERIIERVSVEKAEGSTLPRANFQTMPLLRAAAHIDPNPSKGGGEVIIVDGNSLLPESGPSGTAADIEEYPQGSQISLYVVRSGDSLSSIAKLFDVSVNTIIWANDLKRGSFIQPGQTLVILPITGVKHIVSKGDTVEKIAKKYKAHTDDIISYNNLIEGAPLAVGSELLVPDGEIPAPVYQSTGALVRGSSGPEYAGYYLRPIVGGIRSQGLHGYNGIDIAASMGTPILASAPGEVIIVRSSGWNGGYGRYVVISHANGTQTLYAHNSENIVVPGQRVVQGQIIGYIGNSGKSTGPHVHFEIRGAKNPF